MLSIYTVKSILPRGFDKSAACESDAQRYSAYIRTTHAARGFAAAVDAASCTLIYPTIGIYIIRKYICAVCACTERLGLSLLPLVASSIRIDIYIGVYL